MRAGPKGDRVVSAGRGVVRRTNSADARQCMIPHPAAAYRAGPPLLCAAIPKKGLPDRRRRRFSLCIETNVPRPCTAPLQPGWWLEESGHEKPEVADVRGADGGDGPGAVPHPRHPHRPHQDDLGLSGPALCALVCGPVMDWCSALWRISWALSSSPPGISSWLHPVYHGRGCWSMPCAFTGRGSRCCASCWPTWW